MPGNSNLHDSSRNKQDEFYTNLQLVEDELKHYRAHFKGKRVLCNRQMLCADCNRRKSDV